MEDYNTNRSLIQFVPLSFVRPKHPVPSKRPKHKVVIVDYDEENIFVTNSGGNSWDLDNPNKPIKIPVSLLSIDVKK